MLKLLVVGMKVGGLMVSEYKQHGEEGKDLGEGRWLMLEVSGCVMMKYGY